MKKQRLILIFLLLGVFTGCRKPINEVVVLPEPGKDADTVYGEEGGTLQFTSGPAKYAKFVITLDPSPCSEGTTLVGTATLPATCHLISKGEFSYVISSAIDSNDLALPYTKWRKLRLYIRGCHVPCRP